MSHDFCKLLNCWKNKMKLKQCNMLLNNSVLSAKWSTPARGSCAPPPHKCLWLLFINISAPAINHPSVLQRSSLYPDSWENLSLTNMFIHKDCRFEVCLCFKLGILKKNKHKHSKLCHPLLIPFTITDEKKLSFPGLREDRTWLGLRMGEMTCLLRMLSGFASFQGTREISRDKFNRVQEKCLSKDIFIYLELKLWIRRFYVCYSMVSLENRDLPSVS